jgi:hypothetical protein
VGTTNRLALLAALAAAGNAGCGTPPARPAAPPATFTVEEATIDGIHAAIRSGRTTCQAVVQAYVDRARAYNSVCTRLVTADGSDIAPATGYVRAGARSGFPRSSVRSRAFDGKDAEQPVEDSQRRSRAAPYVAHRR